MLERHDIHCNGMVVGYYTIHDSSLLIKIDSNLAKLSDFLELSKDIPIRLDIDYKDIELVYNEGIMTTGGGA
jgi:hypothetical protein